MFGEIPYDEHGQPPRELARLSSAVRFRLPPIRIAHIRTPTIRHRYSVKGMAARGRCAFPATIANAVRDALVIGSRVNETPLTPQRVLAAINAQRGTA